MSPRRFECAFVGWLLVAVFGLARAGFAADRKLTRQERVELIRGLSAEFATATAPLPQSKKTLIFESNGAYDKALWEQIGRESGPAARVGDLVQVTKLELEDDRIVFQLNGGAKGGRKWYERIEVGTGTRTTPIGGGSYSAGPRRHHPGSGLPRADLPAHLRRGEERCWPRCSTSTGAAPPSSTSRSCPNRSSKPSRRRRRSTAWTASRWSWRWGSPTGKVRETVDEVELEDWIYGTPPGRIVFVTFEGEKVIRVKESYAGLGGSVAPPLPTPR